MRRLFPLLLALVLVAMVNFQAAAGDQKPGVVLAVYDLSVSAAADVATTSITCTRAAAYRVMVAVSPGSSATVLNAVINDDQGGAAPFGFGLNGSTALTAGDLYTFTLALPVGWTLNFSPETTTRMTMVVQEMTEGL